MSCESKIISMKRFCQKSYRRFGKYWVGGLIYEWQLGLETSYWAGWCDEFSEWNRSIQNASWRRKDLCGMERELSARFSFLLSIPAIIGAMALQIGSEGLSRLDILPLFLGFLSSAIVGFIALKILMGIVRNGRLSYFAPYCWALGLSIIIF